MSTVASSAGANWGDVITRAQEYPALLARADSFNFAFTFSIVDG